VIKVLFVCLGNICRSPTADGVLRHLVAQAKLDNHIYVDSAGTGDWHIGHAPDKRTILTARKRGYDLSVLRARLVEPKDFNEFDYILAMDANNLTNLKRMKPASYKGKLDLFLSFSEQTTYQEVPDPYHGDADDFELVLDLVEDAAQGLLTQLQKQLKRH
jgi:protein-tyrosine phosphatase